MSINCQSEKRQVKIESYKHNGTLYRTWKESLFLEDGEPIILANHGTEVMEQDGERWITSELAICQFHRRRWFHTIILFKDDFNYSYYCNIASPYQMREGVLSYIDYDLDLVVDMEGNMKWLDQEEFVENKGRYAYPDHVLEEVAKATLQLEHRVNKGLDPFNTSYVHYWYHRFLSTQKNNETSQATCSVLFPLKRIMGRGGGENGE